MYSLALCFALLSFADDKPFVAPPLGVVVPPGGSVAIPPATPGQPPLHLTIPFNPDAADRADVERLAKRVEDLTVRLDATTRSVEYLLRQPPPAPPASNHAAACAVLPKAPAPKPAAPLYRMTDLSGQAWTHADRGVLEAFVARRNATVFAPRPTYYFAPAYPAFGGGCANGACGR